MKNKIRFRLFAYFVGALLVFSLLIGCIFSLLFTKYNMDAHKKDLENRAIRIAETLSGFFIENTGRGMGQGGYGAYLRFLDDVAMTDVWIVDPNLEQIVRGRGQTDITYKDLPENAEDVVSDALSGNTSFSEKFSALLDAPSITVATPIVLTDGSVAGVVLLHTELSDISDASAEGLRMLAISMIVAVIISFAIAGILSLRFTKPLEKMKQTAVQITNGDFYARTNIIQSDEIGELALAMDTMAVNLATASKESEKLDKLRRDFISNISHELRTPITVIRSSLEALCDRVVSNPKMVSEYHTQMLLESIHLERLVSDLLDLSKLQNPDFKMEIQALNLKDVVEDAVHSIETIAQEKNIEIKTTFNEQCYPFDGDYGRLRQMLTIVINNAVKFSPENTSVRVTLSQESSKFVLSVSDSGCGIPSENLPFIFDRFFMQRSELNKNGSGLGLSIAKQIADRHGIEILLKSKMQKGTKIKFIFNDKIVHNC